MAQGPARVKDLIEAILKGLTSYIPMLASVVSNPKTNIPRLVREPSEPLRHALVFCGISIAIAFVAQAPLLTEGMEFTTAAGALFAVKLFELLLFNAILMILFKLIGGTGTFETTLTASLYIISPVYLFLIFTQIIGMGILAGADPVIARDWRLGTLDFASQNWANFVLAHATEAYAAAALGLFALAATIGWYIYCWSVYRTLHQLTRTRSAFAYLIAFVLFYGVAMLRIFAIRGLTAGTALGMH